MSGFCLLERWWVFELREEPVYSLRGEDNASGLPSPWAERTRGGDGQLLHGISLRGLSLRRVSHL